MIYAIIFLGISFIVSMVMYVYKPFKQDTECKHVWGPVTDGYQFCNFCGLSRKAECVHDWELEDESRITRTADDAQIGKTQIYKCSKCSERKYVRLELGSDPVSKII